jgi:muramoyltetrapeptide carboxypeptidase
MWPLLRSGDPVSVVAPSSPFELPAFEAGLKTLASLQLVPRYDPGITSRRRYLAGDDERRANELESAWRDEETRAIFCVRGGYGLMRLLPRLRPATWREKIFVGFSDLTALHALLQIHGRESVHGPVLTQLAKQPREVVDALSRLLFEGVAPTLQGRATRAGSARGRLLGGNLSVLSRLVGTPFMPSLKGALLLLEDVGERPYRLDRMLTHMRLAGLLDDLGGIVLGEFTECEEKDADYTSAEVLRELLADVSPSVPILEGIPSGHGAINFPLVLGAEYELDVGVETGMLTPLGPRRRTT